LTRFPASRLPGFPASRLPGFPASRLPGFPASRLPGFPASRLPGSPAHRLASVALASVALASVALYYRGMVTTNAPRATTQLTLQRYATIAIDEKWSASQLARAADCNVHTAEKFLSRLADTGMEKTQREVLTLANEYRHTLERTAARSREYLESISHLELDQLDKDQRSLRKDALSSLSSLSSMLRLEITGDSSASAPPRLGNL
jgi:hypothetical protein